MTTESSLNPRGRRIFLGTVAVIAPLILCLAVARANNRMSDSGVVSWSAILVLTLMSSLILIGLRRSPDGSKLSAVEKWSRVLPVGVLRVLRNPSEFRYHEHEIPGLVCAREAAAEDVTTDDGAHGNRQFLGSRHLRWAAMLHKLNRVFLSQPDLRSVADALVEVLTETLPNSAITIRLYNQETRQLEKTATFPPTAMERLVEIEDDCKELRWRVLEEKKPRLIRNLNSRWHETSASGCHRNSWDTCFVVPLSVRGEVLAVLTVYAPPDKELGPVDLEYLTTLADHAALAIHNWRLYSQTIEQRSQLHKANIAAETSDRIKSDFLNVVSHEFKTPLSVIMGYAGMMQDGLLGSITDEQGKALEEVLRSSDELMALVMSMLQAGRIDAEAVEVRREDLRPTVLLEELRSEFCDPGGKGLTLVWDCPADLPVVRTDGKKLKYVLANLIDNAVKFTECGRVIVSSRSLPEAGTIEFQISDTGMGIPRTAVPEVFREFQQLDGSITRAHDGLGLGLYIAKKYSELLGGRISVASEPGRGSTFTLSLPVVA